MGNGNRIFIGIVAIWVALLLITTVDIAHNTPANVLAGRIDTSLSEVTRQDLYNHSLTPGITYGIIGTRVWNQLSIVFGTLLVVGGSGVALSMELSQRIRREYIEIQTFPVGAIITAGLSGIAYFVAALLVLEITPEIRYLPSNPSKNGGTVFSNLGSIPISFGGLLVAQAVAVALISIVLTTEIVPKEIVTKREVNRDRLNQHVQNWRQYGTWLISLFISVGLAGSLVFITDVAPFGRSFIIHAIVLFGGGILLVMSFISYKLSCLEQHF